LVNISRRNVSNIAEVVCDNTPMTSGFPVMIVSVKDWGRVVIGGGFGGVSPNNAGKIRINLLPHHV
jgi:hypothetical protein